MNEREIFMEALDLDNPDERSAFLAEQCGTNPELRQRIETLLSSHEEAGSFMGIPIADRLADQAGLPLSADETQGISTDEQVAESLDFLTPSQCPGSLGSLGHYEVLEVIGRGGFGIVVRAFDEKLHRVVAIKIMAPLLAVTSAPRKRFLREARAAAAIRHDNIVSIFSVEEQPIPYLVMEYIDGPTLQQKLDANGPLEVPEIVRLGQQIASGLAAAHGMRLIHRDIKPGNILLENGIEQRIKITDFGLARAVDDASLTQTGSIAGTPMYMAPEQACGAALDHRADLFSLGSVLYLMCSGRPPFRASNSVAVLKRVVEDVPRPIQEIIPQTPQWLCDIIARLHAKQPEDRFKSAQEVANLLGHRWIEMQQQGQVTSLPTPAEKKLGSNYQRRDSGWSRPGARGRRWTTAAALLLLLFGGLGLSEATGLSRLTTTIIRITMGEGTLVIESNDPSVKLLIDGEQVTISGAGVEEVRLRPGSYQLAAIRDGKAIRLDQELVTINRDGREVVRVMLEPEAAKVTGDTASPAPETKPFIRLAGPVVKEQAYDTLVDAVEGSRPGDTIEIRGNGPFVTNTPIVRHPLTIRAAEGFRPVIQQSAESLPTRYPLIMVEAPLILEGLSLERTGDGDGNQDKSLPYGTVIRGERRGVVYAANCRFVNGNGPCFHVFGSPHSTLPECKTARVLNSECLSYKFADLHGASELRLDIENSVLCGWTAFSMPPDDANPHTIRLSRTTHVGGAMQIRIDQWPKGAESLPAEPRVRIDSASNVIMHGLAFGYMLSASDPPPLTNDELEAFIRRAMQWRESHNLNQHHQLWLATKDYKTISTSLWGGPDEWNGFWNQTDTGSIQGDPLFEGGDLYVRATTAMKEFTAEDFRLRWDSPGYRAGADGKDLGPDIDFVGPGEAYERWKASPAYLQWLDEIQPLMQAKSNMSTSKTEPAASLN